MDRRRFTKLIAGSIVATIALPAMAKSGSRDRAKTLVIYHRDSAQGKAFFQSLLAEGAEAFPIESVLDPATKARFARRLLKEPTVVVGLTDPTSSLELQMAASDAFHYRVPEEQFAVEKPGDGSLLAWSFAPVSEINAEVIK